MQIDPKVPIFRGQPPVPDLQVLKNKLLLRPDEVAAILRISRRKVYDMVDLSELEGIKIGQCLRIKSKSVLEILAGEFD